MGRKLGRAIKRNAEHEANILKQVPRAQWPIAARTSLVVRDCWLSAHYLVQVFEEEAGVVRLTVNCVERAGGDWLDGISWDALQDIKAQVGFADRVAVEVYPREEDVVNVANMRHLWVLPPEMVAAMAGVGWQGRRAIKQRG